MTAYDTISRITDKLKSFVGNWDTPVIFYHEGRALRIERIDGPGLHNGKVYAFLTDKKDGTKLPRKKDKHTETSEASMAAFSFDTRMDITAIDAVNTFRNQLQDFFNEELFEPVDLPVPDGYKTIAEMMDGMTISDVKSILSQLDGEIVRLTAVRAIVIETKKAMKKEMNG